MADPAPAPDARTATEPSAAELKAENELLKEKLKEFEGLQEDLMAQRVFEKTQKLLKTYLTIGGLVVLVASVIGVTQIVEFAKRHAQETIEQIAKDQSAKLLDSEAEKQRKNLQESGEKLNKEYADLGNKRRVELEILATEQGARLRAIGQPIGTTAVVKGGETLLVVDFTKDMGPIRDQGPESSACGFALAAAMEFRIKKDTGKTVALSPRYIYNRAREKRGNPDLDQGATFTDAIDVVRTSGAVEEAEWPYAPGGFRDKPPAGIEKATRYWINQRMDRVTSKDVKTSLSAEYPVGGGLQVFRSNITPPSGVLAMPLPGESPIGSLGVCFVGYDEEKKRFKFRNSLGLGWGEAGYGYATYEYVDKFLLDAWMFTMRKSDKP